MPAIKLSPARKAAAKVKGNGKAAPDYQVKDISLADWGRKTIDVSEQEMPGLMSIRKKYAPGKPLQGGRHPRRHLASDGHQLRGFSQPQGCEDFTALRWNSLE